MNAPTVEKSIPFIKDGTRYSIDAEGWVTDSDGTDLYMTYDEVFTDPETQTQIAEKLARIQEPVVNLSVVEESPGDEPADEKPKAAPLRLCHSTAPKAPEPQRNIKEESEKPVKKTLIEKALECVMADTRLFTDGDTGYALYPVNDHYEADRVLARNFKKYVQYRVRKETGKHLSGTQISDIISEIEAQAVFEGETVQVYGRVGKLGGDIVINPMLDDWKLIRITSDGWNYISPLDCVSSVTVVTQKSLPIEKTIFIRPKGARSLPIPRKGVGTLDDLRPFIGCEDDDARWLLVLAFIVQALFFDGPFPILVILAEKGSGKTCATKALKLIIDPHDAITASVPREPRDMFATAGVSWLMAYDNFSKVQQWLSDLFCRFSTGNATIDRELFTNGEAYIFSAKRPAIVNGINDFFSQGDVIDRSIIMNFERIDPRDRKPEKELWQHFNAILPGIFHDLLDLTCRVLAILPTLTVDDLPRMADFALVGTAVSMALGYGETAFMTAYKGNMDSANDIVLDSSLIVPVIRRLLETAPGNTFEGTPQELLIQLGQTDPEAARNKHWPKTPNVLTGHLKRLAQNMREAGIEVEQWRDHSGRRVLLSNVIGREKTVTTDTPGTDSKQPEPLGENEMDIPFIGGE